MSCTIYIQHDQGTIKVATLKDRKTAEDHWKRVRDGYRDRHGYLPEPIYTETGRKKNGK